jgi:hypothetical protein
MASRGFSSIVGPTSHLAIERSSSHSPQPCTSYFSSRRQCEIVAKLMEDNKLFSAESPKMPNALGKISGTGFQNR